MRRIERMILFLVTILLASPTSAEQLNISDTRMAELGIATQKIEPVTSIWNRSFPAQIVIPNKQVQVVNSLLPGLVSVLHVAEGDVVNTGQLLAEVASPDYLALQQDYIASAARFEMAQKNHERKGLLLEEGIISEKSFLASSAELNVAV